MLVLFDNVNLHSFHCSQIVAACKKTLFTHACNSLTLAFHLHCLTFQSKSSMRKIESPFTCITQVTDSYHLWNKTSLFLCEAQPFYHETYALHTTRRTHTRHPPASVARIRAPLARKSTNTSLYYVISPNQTVSILYREVVRLLING